MATKYANYVTLVNTENLGCFSFLHCYLGPSNMPKEMKTSHACVWYFLMQLHLHTRPVSRFQNSAGFHPMFVLCCSLNMWIQTVNVISLQ